MSKQFIQVSHFQRTVLGLPARNFNSLTKAEADLSAVQLSEEVTEFFNAYKEGKFVEMADALIDSIYFAMGVLYKMGLDQEDFEAVFTIVHECNMEKKKGIKDNRPNSKAPDATKPEGWVSPEAKLKEVLK